MAFAEILSASRANAWRVSGKVVSGRPVPAIMGIVNNTPDSFFDGGKFNSADLAYEHAVELLEAGAAIIDVGGESSRPGSTPVPAEEEIRRTVPVIKRLDKLRSERDFLISIDTVKSETAAEALKAGADIVNDISALSLDPQMAKLIAETGAASVLNHMRGNFGTMQLDFKPYENVVEEVKAELEAAAGKLLALNVAPETICLDPGIGFGKTAEDNLALIAHAEAFLETGHPVLYGMSRKSFIAKLPGLAHSDRLIPTVAAGILAALGGATVIRVHDVFEARESLALLEAFKNGPVHPV